MKVPPLLYTTQAETGKSLNFYLSIQAYLGLGLWRIYVLLMALKLPISSLFIYVVCAERILNLNIEKNLGQELGEKKFSLISES